MRADAIGLFWEDIPAVKPPPKEKQKRTPPEPHWLKEDYLPGLSSILLNPDIQTHEEKVIDHILKDRFLVFDIECYINYFLCAFKSVDKSIQFWFERTERKNDFFNNRLLEWVLKNATLISFNGNNYDVPMLSLAIGGLSTEELKVNSDLIIKYNVRPNDILKEARLPKVKLDHIDIKEVAPGHGNLKIYGGRVHTKRMQDLPFDPDSELFHERILITRNYCINDLDTTIDVFNELSPFMILRYEMSKDYGIDLRSKSDAQIAEAVISKQIIELNGRRRIERPYVPVGTTYKYIPPKYMQFQTVQLEEIYQQILDCDFVVSESGAISKPDIFNQFDLKIGDLSYTLGIGGLHSTEKNVSYESDSEYTLLTPDVVSYYPYLILNNEWYPKHLGLNFIQVYKRIVEARIDAKRRGQTDISDRLKIVINGSFGKLSSPYSNLYSPDLLIQVTITGQLTLLMLIEAYEQCGISVVSANTDGIVARVHKSQMDLALKIIKSWEVLTDLEMEVGTFKGLYSRDVNTYIALDHTGKPKLKGGYSKGDLSKNVSNEVCLDAVIKCLSEGIPVERTVVNCRDIRKFITIRSVKGGAVKIWPNHTEYLGKSVRWYFSKKVEGTLVYALTGNKVPNTEGARPLMELEEFPQDIDFDKYISECYSMLGELGKL